MNADALAHVLAIYQGSNGDATKALYARLEKIGPVGIIAVNVFRAHKASARAKVYRGGQRGRGSYRGMAYDRKHWSMSNLCAALEQHADAAGIKSWGWGRDDAAKGYEHVLYVELPTGQISYHDSSRGKGPDYPSRWDGERGVGVDRILRFVVQVLEASELLNTEVA